MTAKNSCKHLTRTRTVDPMDNSYYGPFICADCSTVLPTQHKLKTKTNTPNRQGLKPIRPIDTK